MKMIGIAIRSATSFCKSRPLRAGRATSRTRQCGTAALGRDRNSFADANVSGCHPTERISNSSDSRTEMSSSTTSTIGFPCDMGQHLETLKIVGDPSARPQRGIERLTQRRLAEWLEQALDRTLREQVRTDGLVGVSSNIDDRNLLPATRQFPLEIGPGHARHGDVEDQAARLAEGIGREELVRRREGSGGEAELPEQVRQRLPHGL